MSLAVPSTSTAYSDTAVSSLTINAPSGLASGDLLVAFVAMNSSATGTEANMPSGWTIYPGSNTNFYNYDASVGMHAYYKVAGGSEPGSYTFGWTGSKIPAGIILRVTGQDASAPLAARFAPTSSGTTLAPATVTTTVDNAIVIRACASKTPSYTLTVPSGDTSDASVQTTGGAGAKILVSHYIQTPAGTTNANTIGSSSAQYLAEITLSFAPSAPSASFTVDKTSIPAGHSGAITLTLSGMGTTWTSGSTVTVTNSLTGTTTVTKGTWTRSSDTSATLTVTTGAGAGTYKITVDSVDSPSLTVATPSLAIIPTSGTTGTTPSLTLTGTNTLWSGETAAGLFSVSGGTGASIATPSVSNNTSATATLTVGSAANTLTVTDTSTGQTASFTASAPSLVAGVASFASAGTTTITLTATDASGGTAPYTYQWQRNVDGGAYSNLSGKTSLTCSDTTPTAGHAYGYKLVYTDNASVTATSNAVTGLTVYAGSSRRRMQIWRLM